MKKDALAERRTSGTVDLNELARRARVVSEVARVRAAARLPLLVAPFFIVLAIMSAEPGESGLLAALALAMTAFFRWRGYHDGRAAVVGLVCGLGACFAAFAVQGLFPNWTCDDAGVWCGLFIGVCTLTGARFLFTPAVRRQRQPHLRGASIAGLLSAVSASVICLGHGDALLWVAAAAAAGAATRLASVSLVPSPTT